MYIRDNKFAFNELKSLQSEIETVFGDNLTYEELRKDCRIKYEKEGVDFENANDWNLIINFLTDTMIRFYDSFQTSLTKIKTELKS